ncbi:MAG: hypothetical protein ACO3L6_09380 [Dehalococcoidia bacterium]|jgi:hypothetical protein
MDPQTLSRAEWGEIGNALKFLWLALGLALIAGPSLLTAHAIIPSAIDTKTVASKWTRFRAPLYIIGVICVVGIAASFVVAFSIANDVILNDFYGRWWQ